MPLLSCSVSFIIRQTRAAAKVTYSPPMERGGQGGMKLCADESPSNSPFARGRIKLPQAERMVIRLKKKELTAYSLIAMIIRQTRAAAKVTYSPPWKGGAGGGDETLRRWIPL